MLRARQESIARAPLRPGGGALGAGPTYRPPDFSPVPERASPRRRRNLPGAAAARLGQQVAVLPSCAQRRHIERQKKTSHRGRAVRVFSGGRPRSGLAPAGRPAKPARAARRRLFALARAVASLRCVAHRSPLSSRFVVLRISNRETREVTISEAIKQTLASAPTSPSRSYSTAP